MRGGRPAGWVLGVACMVAAACAGQSFDGEPDGSGGAASGSGGASANDAGSGRSSAGMAQGGRAGTQGGQGGRGGTQAAGGPGQSGRGGAAGEAGYGGVPEPPVIGVCGTPRVYSTNLIECDGGFVHRPLATACPLPPRDPDAGPKGMPAEQFDGEDFECTSDVDCADGAYCVRRERNDEGCYVAEYSCYAPCETDGDCPGGTICACENMVHTWTQQPITLGLCRPAECETDASCPDGAMCVAQLQHGVRVWRDERGSIDSFHCQSPGDECAGADGCPPFPGNRDNEFCETPSCVRDGNVLACSFEATCDDTPCETLSEGRSTRRSVSDGEAAFF